MTRIIDSQVHVWEPPPVDDPWSPAAVAAAGIHGDPLDASRVVSAMTAAGVDAAVLVPPFFAGFDNAFAIGEAERDRDRFRVMARLDLSAPDAASRLDRLMTHPLVCGLRLLFMDGAGALLADGSADWVWPLAAQRDIPVMIGVPGQLRAASRVASAFPDLRLAIDHLGLSGQAKDAAIAGEIDELLELARLDNVSVKASALPCYSTEPYPYPSLHHELERVLDAFGPQRVFWGSDYSRLRGSYRSLVRWFCEDLDFLDGRDLEAVMGRSLSDWLGWQEGDR